jgi:hypothetical protein
MHDERNLPVLRREVLPPPSTSPGWGLIMIAATALSFALAGSLLMVRAATEMERPRPALPAVLDLPPEVAPPTPVVQPPPMACRGPVYHASGDGRAEAVFELCPPRTGHIKRIVAD